MAGNLGYALASSLRLTLSGEKSVTRAGYTNCTCGPYPCCAGANPSYAWLGAGLEARVGLGRWVDLHAAGDVGVIVRNAWRPAARTNIGFDVKLGRVALGPVLGLIVTSRDSLFDDRNGNRLTGYFGLRLALALNL